MQEVATHVTDAIDTQKDKTYWVKPLSDLISSYLFFTYLPGQVGPTPLLWEIIQKQDQEFTTTNEKLTIEMDRLDGELAFLAEELRKWRDKETRLRMKVPSLENQNDTKPGKEYKRVLAAFKIVSKEQAKLHQSYTLHPSRFHGLHWQWVLLLSFNCGLNSTMHNELQARCNNIGYTLFLHQTGDQLEINIGNLEFKMEWISGGFEFKVKSYGLQIVYLNDWLTASLRRPSEGPNADDSFFDWIHDNFLSGSIERLEVLLSKNEIGNLWSRRDEGVSFEENIILLFFYHLILRPRPLVSMSGPPNARESSLLQSHMVSLA